LLDIFRNFLTEYLDPDTHKPVRDIRKIAKRYLLTYFFYDIISLFTLPIILSARSVDLSEVATESEETTEVVDQVEIDNSVDHGDVTRLLYLLRLLRIRRILVILHTQTFQTFIKLYYRSNLQSAIKRNSQR